ncbi:GIY-YIG nuclease with Zinc finger domain [Orpheovirus IHUMI-LCC2]|uniref:GIY-YIG nuclease with Zinc finger domain n=1 Tax=Orpheovirus IHUMI-LCC2 TaxID=2023057 RepID=A0A2I2L4G4_9VIRU|nr:GIY-YIG nuclease with Zinc finger domain [Orpheovirus IHUMI-LCC2]SNW62423.1 GIY-YIG nuclease with Zinc finger domain [Orpheovirus IHUMI-LCC2]
MESLYILELEYGRIYVGKTRRLYDRILEHFTYNGSIWTKLYRPIKILEIIEDPDDFDEDKYTKIYMRKYGIDKVRGGSYVTQTLPYYQIQSLEKELYTSSDKCFQCGKQGHYIKDCPQKIEKSEGWVSSAFSWLSSIFIQRGKLCERCGRNSHASVNCYAKKHLNGKYLND